MRKINLENYTVHSKVPDKLNPGALIDIEYSYPLKDSILMLMFSPELRLNGSDLVKHQALALKIEACKKAEMLLEETEWQMLKDATDKCSGFNRADYEMIERIRNAEEVQVQIKK